MVLVPSIKANKGAGLLPVSVHSRPIIVTNMSQRQKLAVPRSEIARRETKYERRASLNPNKRGPKPKGDASRDLRA